VNADAREQRRACAVPREDRREQGDDGREGNVVAEEVVVLAEPEELVCAVPRVTSSGTKPNASRSGATAVRVTMARSRRSSRAVFATAQPMRRCSIGFTS
jgi:hypothetical protein